MVPLGSFEGRQGIVYGAPRGGSVYSRTPRFRQVHSGSLGSFKGRLEVVGNIRIRSWGA